MKVILDTNIIVADFNFTSNTYKIFLESLEKTGHTLFMLQIVMEEVVNKYRETLTSIMNELNKAQERYCRLTQQEYAPILPEQQVQELTTKYENALEQKLITKRFTTTRFVSYPNIPHFSLVRKALLRKKPFSENGTG